MGVIQFQVEYPDLVPRHGLNHADFVMFDGRIIASDNSLSDGILRCHRPQSDSSHLRLLYRPGPQQTAVVAHSTSLRESNNNYRLEVELARGQLSRLRNHRGVWAGAGLRTSDLLNDSLKEAQREFFQSAATSGDAEQALRSLRLTETATAELCQLYTSQRLAFRRQRSTQFPVSIGCRLTERPENPEAFLEAFSAVAVQTNWDQLEPRDGEYDWDRLDELVNWATAEKLAILGGPLINLAQDRFPAWMQSWKGDIVNLQSFASDFVETVVGRYVGRIRHWEVVCGANCGGSATLTEEQRLNLVLRSVQAARQVDEQIQISLRIMQPWGEYLSDTANRLAPVQFIDTLRRTGVHVSEVNLDLRIGVGPWRSLPRDQLALSQLLDHWSLLQIPVNVNVGLPAVESWDNPEVDITEEQADWLERTLMMCLSKQHLRGVFLDQWREDEPNTGLLRDDGSLHPAWDRLRHVERNCWPA